MKDEGGELAGHRERESDVHESAFPAPVDPSTKQCARVMSQSSCERAAALSNAALLIRQRAHAFSAEHATERAVVSYLAAHNISLTTNVDVGAG
jgi:hypothetical protein